MLVQVTKEHIEQGIRSDSRNCAISLAIQGMGYEKVVTSWCVCSVTKTISGEAEVQYAVPPEARYFISQFDRGEPVEPIKFVMEKWDGTVPNIGEVSWYA